MSPEYVSHTFKAMVKWPEIPGWKPIVARSGDDLAYEQEVREQQNKFGKLCAHAYYVRLVTIVETLVRMQLEIACKCNACVLCDGRIMLLRLRKELGL